jgi:hypothetical protein
MIRQAAYALTLLTALACEQAAPPPVYTLRILAVDRDDRPMSGVTVALGKQPAGVTGPDGTVTVQKTGAEGTRVAGHIECPEGFTSEAPDFVITLSQIRGLNSKEVAPLLQTVSCKPTRHEGVILVKATHPGISVVVDGTPTTQTDTLGFAYVYVQKDPTGAVDIVLDTTAQPKLQPQSPSRKFQFKGDDEIFEFEQPFVEEKEKPKKKPRRAPAPPKKHIPQRL